LRCFPDIQTSAFRNDKDGVSFDLPVDGSIRTAAISANSLSTLARDGKIRIRITASDKGSVALRIRKPDWVDRLSARINGEVEQSAVEHGSLHLQRNWRAGDVVEVSYAMSLRSEPAGKDRASYWFGPWLLGAPASENPAYFNELTVDNRLSGKPVAVAGGASSVKETFAVPIAVTAFGYIPAEFPDQPGTVTLRAIAEQAGQATTSWELLLLRDGRV
jgi:hypothetical protein